MLVASSLLRTFRNQVRCVIWDAKKILKFCNLARLSFFEMLRFYDGCVTMNVNTEQGQEKQFKGA